MEKKNKAGRALLVVLIAVVAVFGVSFLPLEKWTGGKVKNFSLIRDILPDSLLNTDEEVDLATIDPELLKAQQQASAVQAQLDENGNPIYNDTILTEIKSSHAADGMVVIEDYTAGEVGLFHMRKAIKEGRLARIAVVGDSYIEGDIFTQNLREDLQTKFGGQGVGYMNMHSDFPGFRQSVRQGGNGWTEFAALKKADADYIGLSQHYFIPKGNALATYAGSKQLNNVDQWSVSQFLFISPNNTTIMVKTTGDWVEHPVTGSPQVQCITVNGLTGEFDVRTSDPKLVALGVWLDGTKGIGVDCMSSRGYSGVTLTKVNVDLCREMSKYVNYDLIILEFGINAMTAKQTDYSVYAGKIVEAINHVRRCYPGADVLLMGIGDRGEKIAGSVKSMRSAPYMVQAQRDAARRAHCLFWDTREAMGGEDAIVKWSAEGRANKDYIHLTHKGGKELGGLLSAALIKMINE